MQKHKFVLGQSVDVTHGALTRSFSRAGYTITRLLPFEGDECEYRIKSSGEPFERVVRESQIQRLAQHGRE